MSHRPICSIPRATSGVLAFALVAAMVGTTVRGASVPSKAPGEMRAIQLSGMFCSELMAPGSSRTDVTNLFNEIALAPFTDEQARELLEEPVRGVYDWENEALDFVIQHADGRPYRLQQYALEAVNRMLANKRLNITLTDVEAAHEQLERARGN